MPVTIDGSLGITTPMYNGAIAANAVTPVSAFKNRIINGPCQIFQRGANLSTNNSVGYYVDRFWGFSEPGLVATYSQVSSTGLTGFPFALRMQRNAGNTSTNNLYTGQIVESNNLQDLQGQAVSISFYARAGANFSASGSTLRVWLRTGTVADQGVVQLINGWTGASDQSTTFTLTTSWQLFTITTFTVPSNCQELTVFFSYAATGTAGASDFVDITGIQLEKGPAATSFDTRPYGLELLLCQRYYENNYGQGFAVGSAVSYPNNMGVYLNGFTTTNAQKFFNQPLAVEKRIVGTTNTYYDGAGNASRVSILDGGGTPTNNVAIGVVYISNKLIGVGASNNTNTGIQYFWTCSAEL